MLTPRSEARGRAVPPSRTYTVGKAAPGATRLTPCHSPSPTAPEPVGPRDSGVPAAVRPASFAQKRLWFLAQLPSGNAAYNEPLAFRLDGPLDRDALAHCLDMLTERHEALRTRLVESEGEVWQHIDPPGAGFSLALVDLTDSADPEARLEALRAEEVAPPSTLPSDRWDAEPWSLWGRGARSSC